MAVPFAPPEPRVNDALRQLDSIAADGGADTETASNTSEQTTLLTTASNAPWVLRRHRYFEECSRIASGLGVWAFVITLVVLTAVGSSESRPSGHSRPRSRTLPSWASRWARNGSAEPPAPC